MIPRGPAVAETGPRAAVPAAAIRAGLQALAALDVEVLRYYGFIGAAHVILPPGAATALRDHPLIDYIEPRQWRTLQGSRAAFTAYLSQSTPRGLQMVRAPEAWSEATGAGTRIQIIDTGNARGHEDLPLVPSDNCGGYYDGCDDGPHYHGSHVIGIFTARDNVVGVALV